MITKQKIEIKKLNQNDPPIWFDEIAQIHIDQLPDGVLRNLGVEGLRILYTGLASLDHCGVWGAIEDQHMIGFISGCENTRLFYSNFLVRFGLKLAARCFPQIVKTNSMKNLFKVFIYPFQKNRWKIPPQHEKYSSAELLSIAISSEHHRRGIGRMLVAEFESGCHQWNTKGYYYVATDAGSILSNSFYIGMGYEPYGLRDFTDFQIQIYEKNLG